jgi:hypothetical protein
MYSFWRANSFRPKNPSEVQLMPGGYAPRPKDKMERMDAAADLLLSGGHVSGAVILQALADKLNKKQVGKQSTIVAFMYDCSL